MLVRVGKHHPLDSIILLCWQFGTVIELAIDTLSPIEPSVDLMSLEQTTRVVVDDILGVPGSFNRLQSVKILSFFVFETIQNDAAFFLLTSYYILGLCQLTLRMLKL